MIDIYAFWIGEETSLMKENIQKLEADSRFNLILGPSHDEHSYLMSNCKFYELNFLRKKYAFCSDVWRFWKLKDNSGLYIDIHTVINFGEVCRLCKYIDEHEYIFIFENNYIVCSGVLFSKKNKSDLFSLVNDYYFAISNCDVYYTSCFILSKFLFCNYNLVVGSLFLSPSEISQKSERSLFNNRSLGSWTNLSSSEWACMLEENINKFDRFSKNVKVANWISKLYINNYFVWKKAEQFKLKRCFFMFCVCALHSKVLNIILKIIK